MSPEIIYLSDFVEEAAGFILRSAEGSLAERGRFRLSLSGGQTPRPIYERFAEIGKNLPWKNVFITFGDERCVPPSEAESNFRMAKESLLSRVEIPNENILRMRGELPPNEAADAYEAALAAFGEKRFVHDLILLGLGDDGHTASLFPGTTALEEQERNVVANFVPKFDTYRITLTYPSINAARHVCFLINDAKKKAIVDAILAGESDFPAARIAPTRLTWLLGYPR